ncbi:MAG: WYL domain-containing protein [Candidatus Sericytochromatia bacterium]|nr:WYL domain-containing protein [Candidatus Sericytochromatia bacterium]
MQGGEGDAGLWARFAWFNERLKAGTFPRPSQMASTFGVSVDTARRTIERFERQLGAPIAYDASRKGYWYPPGCVAAELPPAWLASEASSVLLGGLALLAATLRDGEHLGEPLARLLPGPWACLADRIVVETPEHHPPQSGIFVQLLEALANDQTLTVRYRAPSSGSEGVRSLDPLLLHSYAGNWYLYAWCHLRRERRMFSVDRIDRVLRRGPGFDREATVSGQDPREDLAGVFGIHKRLDRQWARVRFVPAVARWVRDQRWHAEQQMDDCADGSLDLRIPYGAEGPDLIREILKWGPDAEVLEPAELRETMRARIRATMERYGTETTDQPSRTG